MSESFRMGLPTDIWLKYYGTAGKPGGKGENGNQPVYRENRPTRLN